MTQLVIESFDPSFKGNGAQLHDARKWAACFQATQNMTVEKATFSFLLQFGFDTGTVRAVVWAATGDVDVDGIPTGDPLAISTNTHNATEFPVGSVFEAFDFDFDGTLELVKGNKYAIGLEPVGTGFSGIDATVFADFDDNLASKNYAEQQSGIWLGFGHGHLGFRLAGTITDKVLMDFYPVEQSTPNESMLLTPSFGNYALGQAFTAQETKKLESVFFALFPGQVLSSRTDGDIVATLYAASGTVGTNAGPTPPALATSVAVNTTQLGRVFGSGELVEFIFPTPYELQAGQDYVVALAAGTSDQAVQIAYDASSSTHSGNATADFGFGFPWDTFETIDTVFYITRLAVVAEPEEEPRGHRHHGAFLPMPPRRRPKNIRGGGQLAAGAARIVGEGSVFETQGLREKRRAEEAVILSML